MSEYSDTDFFMSETTLAQLRDIHPFLLTGGKSNNSILIENELPDGIIEASKKLDYKVEELSFSEAVDEPLPRISVTRPNWGHWEVTMST